ncbi:hypothetical protein PIGHUM_02430 [Pigmentiphaga humi]|uniref:DUF1415 domain-containing protein n=1 Tax=Pigmentiphaga humi TaxID=2478468 RepID=A0A3P4B3Z8_9BURK|nr:DUF1415 domain-containing protein [Pigmentiphaga humi]VCU70358.1 hypothetical protein PIGHUM_02430 [Pigmentiphaga humi]
MYHPPLDSLQHDTVIDATKAWLEKAVIGLNLCPFAKAVHIKDQIAYVVSDARDPGTLLEHLAQSLRTLAEADPERIDTLLLIHPWALDDFYLYNDFLDEADAAVEALGLLGEIQVASFHPDYQFADTEPDDVENYSNRSPYPTLHLLREASVDRAVEAFPEAEQIYERNIETLRALGHEGWQKLGIPPGE